MSTVPDGATREERFAALAHQVGEPLRRYVARRAAPDAVDDVLADTFLVLWRRLDDLPADDPRPWSYGVARNCLANARRSARRQLSLVERITRSQVDETEPIDDSDLHEALATLPELDREVVRLWAWEQLAPREIAVVTGLTANAVSIRLHKAKKRLAAELGKTGGTSGQVVGDGRRSR